MPRPEPCPEKDHPLNGVRSPSGNGGLPRLDDLPSIHTTSALDQPLRPYIFRFLGVKDGSQVERVKNRYAGGVIDPVRQAFRAWLNNAKSVKPVDHPSGYSCKSSLSDYLNSSGYQIPLGEYFLEADGIRVVAVAIVYPYGERNMDICLYCRHEDVAVVRGLSAQWERNLPRLKGVWNGFGNPLPPPKAVVWENIAIEAETRELIESNTVGLFRLRRLYKRRSIPIKRGLLLWGPPGNGKSLTLKLLTRKMPRTIHVTAKDLCAITRNSISDIYAMARRMAPCMVALEDIDTMGGIERGMGHTKALGELLNELDGYESNEGIITVATTNDLKVLDEALGNRPGRFDIKIEFPHPDHARRLQLLNILTRNIELGEDVDLDSLSQGMEGLKLSCAHVSEVVTRSMMAAVDEFKDGPLVLQKRHFEKALYRSAVTRQRIGFLRSSSG